MSERKITLYLLSPTHADRRSQEKFFTAFGFSVNEWETLKNALLRHVADSEVTSHLPTHSLVVPPAVPDK